MEYEFIPIVYPNKPDDTAIPPPLVSTLQTITSEVIPGQGLPFIASEPYAPPAPVAEPTPLPQSGVLVDPAGTLVYHPLTALPATTFNQADNYSLPSLITTMGGDQSLYAPYTETESGRDWSLYPALQQVDMSGFGMTGMGNMNFTNNSVMTNVGDLNFADNAKMLNVGDMDFAPDKTITGVKEIVVSQSGFGSLTINTDGIQSAGDITGIDSLELNTQVLTAIPNALLLNGVPIATISNLPNIYQWATYPALANVELNTPGAGGPHQLRGAAIVSFSVDNYLEGLQNPQDPDNPSGANSRLTMHDYYGDPVEKIIYSTNLTGAYAAPGTYTGVPKWATFKPSQDVDWDGKQITNINEITFNTAIPQLGGASINALNDLNFSLLTAAAGYAGVNNVNNIAFWNPNFPGVPGAYVNLYSKNLTYAGNSSIYLATDTKISAPSLFLGGLGGNAGGKLEILGDAAVVATINGSPCSASWATYPCGNPAGVNMNGQQILACRQIDFQNDNPAPIHNLLSIDAQGYLTCESPPGTVVRIGPGGSAWSTFPATQNVNMAGNNIQNIGNLRFNIDLGNILSVANGTTLQWRGQNVLTGAFPGDNTPNWANYQAVNTVTIPKEHSLNINAENGNFFYEDSHLNVNIYHGVESGHGIFETAPDFISFPTTFQVGNPVFPAREISMTAGAFGFGLNSDTEVNLDGVDVNINGGLVEIGGGAVTINPGGAVLIESADLTATCGVITMNATLGAMELGADGLISIDATLDLNLVSALAIEMTALTPVAGTISLASGGTTSIVSGGLFNVTSDGATWNVGGLTFDAGIVGITWGATTANLASLTATTGDVNWTSLTNFSVTAPTASFAGGALNVASAVTNLIGGTLTINNAAATVISSPVLSLNSTQTVLAAGRPLKTDILQPTTANSLAISGVDTIAGGGSGMDLTNIANFETYSATNVLLPCKSLTANIPTISLTATAGYNLIYTSPTKVWSWLNIPQLLFSYTFNSEIIVSAGAPSGQATSVGIYIVLANLTDPIPSNVIVFKPVTGKSTPNDSANSSIALTANQSFPNDQTSIRQGNSYVIRVFASSLDSPNNTTLTNNLLSFNVINAGGL
jgi:hypothetical protein